MTEIEIKGAEKIIRDLTRYPAQSVKLYGQVVQRGAEKLRDFTKRLPPVNAQRTGYAAKGIPVAPKHGGTLRQSIQKRSIAQLAAGVFPRANYGGYVHDGTKRMQARPFFDWALELGAQAIIDKLFEDAASKLP